MLKRLAAWIRNRNKTGLERCPGEIFHDYETLCLHQPHLNVKGVYQKDKDYFIVCVGLGTKPLTIDGHDLNEWFSRHKIISSPTRLVSHIPPGSKRLRVLNQQEEAALTGIPRNLTFFYEDMVLTLPKTFPAFKVKNENGAVIIYSEQALTPEEINQFNEALRLLDVRISLSFQTLALNTYNQPILDAPLLLTHSSLLPFNDPAITRLWEEDEDFWMANKQKLVQQNVSKAGIFQQGYIQDRSSCIVTDSNKPDNIRNFLSLYQTIYLRLPIEMFHDDYFRHLDCTLEEVKQLCNSGRVKLIADQSLKRYAPVLVHAFTELKSSDIIFSRRLAAVTIADLRTRVPFLFPTFDIDTKYDILHLLHSRLTGQTSQENIYKLTECLASVWGNYFEQVQRSGAYGILNSGSHKFLDLLFRSLNKDYGVEFMDAELGVNYAAAIGANCISYNTYNNAPFMGMLANFYSGIPKDFIIGNQQTANTALDNILAISKDVPVIDFSNSFHSGDIDRFHNLIHGLTKHKKNEAELAEGIRRFNEEVKHYASTRDNLSEFDLRGFLVDGVTAGGGMSMPFSGWFIERLLHLLGKAGKRNTTVRKMEDYLAAYNSVTIPDAVLVARMREQLVKSYGQHKFGY